MCAVGQILEFRPTTTTKLVVAVITKVTLGADLRKLCSTASAKFPTPVIDRLTLIALHNGFGLA